VWKLVDERYPRIMRERVLAGADDRDQAPAIGEQGLSVIPCWPRGKKPAIGSWEEFQCRRADAQAIKGWWDNYREPLNPTTLVSSDTPSLGKFSLTVSAT